MSVYKRNGVGTYRYDFEVGGKRFVGDTGETDKRKAEAAQKREREKARDRLRAAADKFSANMTFGAACVRYMEEVGEHHKNALTTLSNLEWLQAQLGAKTLVSNIDDNRVSFVVAKRRREFRKVGNDQTPKTLVSNATVNRTCTEQLRKVLRRAETKWGCAVGEIDWAGHMLPEPKERVREASVEEEGLVMDQLDRGYDDGVLFAVLTGCRRMEIVGLTWQSVDFFNRVFTVIGKGEKSRTVPMSNAVFDLLWSIKDNDPQWVFTYVAARTDKRKGIVRGIRYPMTDAGLRTAARRAVSGAGIKNLRFHDLRHTAATRILRKSNLRVVQNLLGHAEPSTTAKYAHAMVEDIRAAMDAAGPATIPADELAFRINSLTKRGKSG
ncbi:tyrosine-type recombinase/integrase [Paradevosia shaoguanensis]|uniref:tyrosine-type recombinase/integrase n=1 Tax=Paradevosia shaoguanensis TaxID=1335043 RepID=UPI001FECC6D6|nr:tyrosine-type recombinase/integrase [Paradevosia shaoguanensis]